MSGMYLFYHIVVQPAELAEHMTDNPTPEDQDAGSVMSTSTDWECEFGIRAMPLLKLSLAPLKSSSAPLKSSLA